MAPPRKRRPAPAPEPPLSPARQKIADRQSAKTLSTDLGARGAGPLPDWLVEQLGGDPRNPESGMSPEEVLAYRAKKRANLDSV